MNWSQRVLSAVVFVLLVLVLAAVLQTYRRFSHQTHGEVMTESQAQAEDENGGQARDPMEASQQQAPKQPGLGSLTFRAPMEQEEPGKKHRSPVPEHVSGELAESAVKTAEHVASTIKFGYGSVVKAHSKLKKLVANEPEHKKDCKSPRLEVLGKCACPAGLRWDSAENSCRTNRGAMYFYMYRGQSDHNYPMNNVDMADLAGVMYYLHHEIVKTNATPGVRMNGITRILRWLVTVRPSQEVEEGRTFMPFVAFDSGRCSVPGCNRLWDHYGFAVGCQRLSQGTDLKYAYQSPNNPFGVWYSLPGPCPALRVGEKDGRCMATYRGGMCEDLEESQHCTYTVDFAGEIFLDELEGVKDFGKWQSEGNREYDPTTDRGTGTSFWNFRDSKAWCDRRTARVQSLFKRRYPLLPRDLPAPVC